MAEGSHQGLDREAGGSKDGTAFLDGWDPAGFGPAGKAPVAQYTVGLCFRLRRQ